MCDQIRVITESGGEIDCDTVADLASALGVTTSDFNRDGDECLCGVEEADILAVTHGSMTCRIAMQKEGFPHPTYIVEPKP